VKVRTVHYSKLRVYDVMHLPTKRIRVRGTFAYVSDGRRLDVASSEFLLMREPNNRHDRCAIQIYSRQVLIGYVSAAQAAQFAPLLDQLDADGVVVNGAVTNVEATPKFQVDLPTLPAFRAFVESVVARTTA